MMMRPGYGFIAALLLICSMAFGQAAVTGKLGELTPEQLLMGASGGAVGGAVGGAKESIHAIGEANRPHVGAHTESASSAPDGLEHP